jgi:hypothetical protein
MNEGQLAGDNSHLMVSIGTVKVLRTFLTSYFRPIWERKHFEHWAALAS